MPAQAARAMAITGVDPIWNDAWQSRVQMAIDDHGKHRTVDEMVHQRVGDYDAFKEYQRQVQKNARAMAARLAKKGYQIVSGGTDNHLLLVDVMSKGVTGKLAEESLDHAGITVNKNKIPFDTVDKELSVVGLNNTVTYKGGDPKVDDLGSGNRISKG